MPRPSCCQLLHVGLIVDWFCMDKGMGEVYGMYLTQKISKEALSPLLALARLW